MELTDMPPTSSDLAAAISIALTRDRPRANFDSPRLAGSRCSVCDTTSWPGRAICHACGSPAVKMVDFARTGTVITYTTVHIPRPGLPSPYILCQVRLDEGGPVIFGHLRNIDLVVATPHAVQTMISDDVDDIPWYWFEPTL
jgi:uncharacterized OB-fold protein